MSLKSKLVLLNISKTILILFIGFYLYELFIYQGETIGVNELTFLVSLILVLIIQFAISKKTKSNEKGKKLNILLYIFMIIPLLLIGFFIYTTLSSTTEKDYKPVIYLYPKEETNVTVSIDYSGKLLYTYPELDNKWEVKALPNGTLYDENGREYSYLFWEGNSNINWKIEEGFVVKGEDTIFFLQEKLEYMGLTPKEYNEFIVYWYPKMAGNKYNLIYFAGEDYADNVKLNISPEPDSILRVFMVYKPLNKYLEIEKQKLQTFERNGFTVIEWGGTEIK